MDRAIRGDVALAALDRAAASQLNPPPRTLDTVPFGTRARAATPSIVLRWDAGNWFSPGGSDLTHGTTSRGSRNEPQGTRLEQSGRLAVNPGT